MKNTRKIILVVLIVMLAGIFAVQSVIAANLSMTMPWTVMGAGAMGATGGDVSIQSTLGQPIVGQVMSGSVTSQAGFWYGLKAFLYDLFLPLVIR
jgi:hypothetical protein